MAEKSHRVGVVKVFGCDIIIIEFEFQMSYYVHFRTNAPGKGKNFTNPPTPRAMVQIASQLFFYKHDFGIK